METPHQLLNTATTVSRILQEMMVPHCLVGGLAVSMLSTPRATEDVDFAIIIENDAALQPIAESLSKHLKIIQNKPVLHFEKADIWRMIIAPDTGGDLVIIDFIIANQPEYRAAVESAETITLPSGPIPVATAQALIAMKQLSPRLKDQLDIAELARTT